MSHTALLIVIMSAATVLLRFLPFLLFGEEDRTPALIVYLGKVLPQAVIAMLVVYCLKDISLTSAPYGMHELIGVSAVVLLQIWRRNAIVSILGGTAVYMCLIQLL